MINFSAYTSIASIFWNEIVVNGLFSATTGWLGLSANNWAISGGKANFSGASASDKALYRPMPIRLGIIYRIAFEVTDGITPNLKLGASDGSSVFSGVLNDYVTYPIGVYEYTVTCTQSSDNVYIIGDNTAGSFSLTSFSVKEKIYPTPYIVLPYHNSTYLLRAILYGTNNTTKQLEKSIDFGITWSAFENVFTGTMYSCFVSKDGILFVNCGTEGAGGTELWRSADNGLNWSKVMNTNSGFIRVPWNFAQAANGTMFIGEYTEIASPAGDSPYIWKSTNNGVDWIRIDTFAAYRHIHQVFVDPETQRLYATTGEVKICRYSDDEGATWHTILGSVTTGFVSIISIPGIRYFGSDDVDGANCIWESTNDSTVTRLFKPPEEYDCAWGEIASIEGTSILFATFINGVSTSKSALIAKSTDRGLTWNTIKVLDNLLFSFYLPASDYKHRIPAEFNYLIVLSSSLGLIRIKV
jgi:hypothetical protein